MFIVFYKIVEGFDFMFKRIFSKARVINYGLDILIESLLFVSTLMLKFLY